NDEHEDFEKIPLEKRVLCPVVGEGAITAEGENWKRQREALAPLFSGAVLSKIIPITAQVVGNSLRSLMSESLVKVESCQLTLSWTLEIILRYFLCDRPLGDLPGEESAKAYAAKFLEAERQLEKSVMSALFSRGGD